MGRISWPMPFDFFIMHPRVCGRPRYVRAFVFNSVMMGNLHGFMVRYGLSWLFDSFRWAFGFRAVTCFTCSTLCLQTYRAYYLFQLCLGVGEFIDDMLRVDREDQHVFLYDQADLGRLDLDPSELDVTLEDDDNDSNKELADGS